MTPEELKALGIAVKTVQDTMTDIDVKVKGFDAQFETLSGLDKEKVKSAIEAADKVEELSQKALLAATASENEKKEIEDRMKNLELQLVKAPTSEGVKYKETPEFKAFNELVRLGTINTEELKEFESK